jgi:hypothetical protein
MSRYFSPKYLKYRRASQGGQQIDFDKPCRACSYNLRGLRIGGKCPECGVPIRPDDAAGDALVDAPLRVIQQLRLGFILTLACLPLLPLLPISMAVMKQSIVMIQTGTVILCACWIVSVWIATPIIDIPAGTQRGFTSKSKLRIAARYLQLGWIGFAITLLLGPVPAVGTALMMLTSSAGIAGIVLLAILHGRLAEWCRDDLAQRMYNLAAWGVGGCYLGILLSTMFASPFMLLGCSFFVLWIFSIGCFFLATASLGRSVFWAAVISQQQSDRDRRLTEGLTPGPATLKRPTGAVPLSDSQSNAGDEPDLDLPEQR